VLSSGSATFAPSGQLGVDSAVIALPRDQCTLQMTNHNATTAHSMTAHMWVTEQVTT